MLKALSKFSLNLSVLFLFFFSQALLSQAAQQRLDGDTFMLKANMNVQGSAMLYDDWQKADLIDNNGSVVEGVLINYNGLEEALICKLDDGTMLQLNKYLYTKAVLGNSELYNLTAYGATGYGKALFIGNNYQCFEKMTATKTTTDSNGYNQIKDYYKIRKSNKTILKIGDRTMELKRSTKEFDKALPGMDIKGLVKANKLKLSKDEDLVHLLQLLDE